VASGPAASFPGSPGAILEMVKTITLNPKSVIPIRIRRFKTNPFIPDPCSLKKSREGVFFKGTDTPSPFPPFYQTTL
jgi:hypothetical protein